ncbi:MAG: N-acetylmuramoyl-L-alanine amidase [Hyphomicrobiaceae bacterium]
MAFFAGAYFGGPRAADQVQQAVTSDPPIPQHLKDDLAAGYDAFGMLLQSGPRVGAASSTSFARPQSYLLDRGLKYEWSPTTRWTPRGSSPVQAIVVHVTGGGSCGGITDFFKTGTPAVSAHFLVCPDKVVQQVEVGDVAWHAGIWGARQNLTNPMIAGWWNAGINPNTRTVGIETLLADGQQLDNFPTMRRNLVTLLAALAEELNLPPNRDYIIGHFELDGVNRAVDPRCCMDLDAVVADAAAIVHAHANQLPEPSDEWGATDPSWGGRFNNWKQRWVGLDGFEYDAVADKWYNAEGLEEWGDTDPDTGNRWNAWRKVWVSADGRNEYDPATNGPWICARDCLPATTFPAAAFPSATITPPRVGDAPPRDEHGAATGLFAFVLAVGLTAMLSGATIIIWCKERS